MSILLWVLDFVGFGGLGFAVLAAGVFWISGRSMPGWGALLMVAVLGIPLVGIHAAKTAQYDDLQAEFSEYKLKTEKDRADALQQALAREKALTAAEHKAQETIDYNSHEAQIETQKLKARVTAADAASRSLRQQLDAITGANAAGNPAGSNADLAAQLTAARSTIGMLADLYGRCDRRAGARAEFADAAHAAGGRCEQDYAAAQQMTAAP